MDERLSDRSSSHNQSSYEGYRSRSASGTPIEQRRSLDVGQHTTRRRSPLATEFETISYDSPGEEGRDPRRSPFIERRSPSGSPQSIGQPPPRSRRDKGKGKEREMSSSSYYQSRIGGTSSDRARTTSSTSDRRPEISRTSTTSTGTTSRQGSEEARIERKDDRTAGGNDSGGGSGSGNSRSRLVSGVFVRY